MTTSEAGASTRGPAQRLASPPRGVGMGGWWLLYHRGLVAVVAVHAVVLFGVGRVTGYTTFEAAAEAFPLAVAAVFGVLLERYKLPATLVVTTGLVASSAIVLHLARGGVEGHLHFLLVLGLIALYQSWPAFLLALAFTIEHHIIFTSVAPHLIFPESADAPWPAFFANLSLTLAMAAVYLVAWRLLETSTEQVTSLSGSTALILNGARQGIYGLDPNGNCTFINPAAANMLGWKPAELVGRRLHDVIHHSRPDGTPLPIEECVAHNLLAGSDPTSGEDEVLWRRDGTSFPVEYLASAITAEGALVGAVVIFDDITERLRVQDEQHRMQRLEERELAQREVLHHLQETVRPPKPSVPNTELGVHYLPAEEGTPAGGDLYDWQMLPTGDLHIAVIDVAGKGVAATKDALAVAHALRMVALDGRPMSELVVSASALLTAQSPELVATVLIARYNPETGQVRLAGASHPPAILVTSEGEVRELHAPGLAIGWPGAGSFEVIEAKLERNDSLILYTDGLVEAGKDIGKGLADAQLEASRLHRYPADQLARALVDSMLSHGIRRDDTLALVLRRRMAPVIAGHVLGPFEHKFRPTEAVVPLARHLLEDWLANQPVETSEIEDLPLVVSELCTNAVRAAETYVTLRAWGDGDSLVIEVEDDGGGHIDWQPFDDLYSDIPDTEMERGRGLFLADALTDELTVTTEGRRTRVRAVKRAVLASGDEAAVG